MSSSSPTYNVLYSIRVSDTPVRAEDLPEYWNGARRLFVIAQVPDPEVPDQARYDLAALDGELCANATPAATAEAWIAMAAMLVQRLEPSDPLKELLVDTEARYRRLVEA